MEATGRRSTRKRALLPCPREKAVESNEACLMDSLQPRFLSAFFGLSEQ